MSARMPVRTATDTIVLIHGLWLTPLSWEHWIERFSGRGYKVIAPSWPRMEAGVEQLRRNPSTTAGLGVHEIVEHYAAILRQLDAPPILIGHSFGGTLVQLLLDRGFGAAGVAIHSMPVKGVFAAGLSTMRSCLPLLANPWNVGRSIALTPKQFHYAFTNTLSEHESAAVYDRYQIPGPGRVLFQAACASLDPRSPTRIDFRNAERAPLLLIAGDADHLIPSSVNQANASRYKSSALTEFVEFPGRSHYTVGQAGWEDVADYALKWAVEHARVS